MTDRELLELAAKAAGYTLDRHTQKPWAYCLGGVEWNPLTDDGDALRLAVALRMLVDDIRVGYMAGNIVAALSEVACYESRNPDPYAATRRAIVRAAAETGKAMP